MHAIDQDKKSNRQKAEVWGISSLIYAVTTRTCSQLYDLLYPSILTAVEMTFIFCFNPANVVQSEYEAVPVCKSKEVHEDKGEATGSGGGWSVWFCITHDFLFSPSCVYITCFLQNVLSQIREDIDSQLKFESFHSSRVPAVTHKVVRQTNIMIIMCIFRKSC